MYILSPEALQIIQQNQAFRLELAKLLQVSENSIYRFVRDNEEDGNLTKAVCLTAFEDWFRLPSEQILLPTSNPTVHTKISSACS